MIDRLKRYFISIYILVLLAIPITFILLFLMLQNSQDKQNDSIVNMKISQIKSLSKNIEKKIFQLNKQDLVKSVINNPDLSQEVDNTLSLLSTQQYRYVYLIYQDKEGFFRYLADGSKDLAQRGLLKQKFTPTLDIWEKIIKTQEPIFSTQQELSGLWITYLYPIMRNNKLEAILAVDFSMQGYQALIEATEPFFGTVYILAIFLFIVLAFNFFQAFLYFKQRNKTNLDPLTHLHNRNYLAELMKTINLKNSVVILADIDFFKKVNDTYGHDVGDIVLKEVAKRLVSATRSFDVIIRYGGEEFLLILKNLENLQDIKEICERILQEISIKPIRLEEGGINVTISLGVNTLQNNDKSVREAIKNADIALYQAKESGRNKAIYV